MKTNPALRKATREAFRTESTGGYKTNRCVCRNSSRDTFHQKEFCVLT